MKLCAIVTISFSFTTILTLSLDSFSQQWFGTTYSVIVMVEDYLFKAYLWFSEGREKLYEWKVSHLGDISPAHLHLPPPTPSPLPTQK